MLSVADAGDILRRRSHVAACNNYSEPTDQTE